MIFSTGMSVLGGVSASFPALGGEIVHPNGSDWGGVGLLQTRTARMREDGTIDMGMSYIYPDKRYFINYQATPWLETTFRYVEVEGAKPGSKDDNYYDRSFDLKIRLFEEGPVLPEISVGLQDLGGTGIFSAEYIVGNKRWWNWDFSFGMGWGRMAETKDMKNPLTAISGSFGSRANTNQSKTNTGGNVNFGNLFHGEYVGLFGGAQYYTPIEGLSLKLEVSSSKSLFESRNPDFKHSSRINAGIHYRLWDNVDLGLAWENGSEIMARASFTFNPNATVFSDEQRARQDPPMPDIPLQPWQQFSQDVDKRQKEPQIMAAVYGAQLHDRLQRSGIAVMNVELTKGNVVITVQDGLRHADPSVLMAAAEDADRAFGGRLERVVFKDADQPASDAPLLTLDMGGEPLPFLTPGGGFQHNAIGASIAVDMQTASLQERLTLPAAADPASLTDNPAFRSVGATHVATEMAAIAQRGHRSETAHIIMEALRKAGYTPLAIDITRTEVIAYVTDTPFRTVAKNVGRVSRVLAGLAPPSVATLTVVMMNDGLEVANISILRDDLVRAVAHMGSPEEIWRHADIRPAEKGIPETAIRPERSPYPLFSWALEPRMRQQLMDPDQPYRFEIFAQLSGEWQPRQGLIFSGAIGQPVFGNFSDIPRSSNSELPHVRSDIARYLSESDTFIERLQASYLWQPAENWYARTTAGYLEWMYAGFGGEILYRPQDKPWAIGVDVNHVWQRAYNGLFGLLDYNVTTGHLSLYMDTAFYNYDIVVRMGRYLARDWGATVELSRTFDSGFTIGAFATLTNVPFEKFGEGSFDKGIFMSIPLETLMPRSTGRKAGFTIRPLERDGGRSVNVAPRLYPMVLEGQVNAVERHWGQITK